MISRKINGMHVVQGERKRIVEQIQRAIICDQVDEITRESRVCSTCASVRAIHDYRTRVLDTLFGRLRVKAARLRRCPCDTRSMAMPAGPVSPLAFFFPDRATPELQRLHAELGSRHSFREAARLMKSFLPCRPPHHTTVHGQLGRIAERLECSRRASSDAADATPKVGLTVFLDGAHIPCLPEYQQRHQTASPHQSKAVSSAAPLPHLSAHYRWCTLPRTISTWQSGQPGRLRFNTHCLSTFNAAGGAPTPSDTAKRGQLQDLHQSRPR